jgi:thiol-disulfide isomerase/thioredoxin
MIKKSLLLVFLTTLFACSNVGENLPSFSLTSLDGKTITEKNLVGKIVVINVWATWCHNCLNEMDELNELVVKYAGDTSVVFLGLSDEEPNKIITFLKRREFKYTPIPNGLILTDAIQTRLVKTYPQHIVLGKDLKIAFEATGELKGAVAVLSEQIDKLKE